MNIHTETVFAYSSLQQPYIQETVFNEIFEAQPDTAPGYKMGTLMIQGLEHACAVREDGGVLTGSILHLTPEQLVAADHFETKAYRRIRVTTTAGHDTWMYIAAE